MKIVTGTGDSLSAGQLFEMAHYRYKVFVEKLGWDLSPRGRLELDRFDRRDTVYVIAQKDDGGVRGVARLLPTNRPYLLADAFPQLLGACGAPRSSAVWELSRFAAIDPDAPTQDVPRFGASDDALVLLANTMRAAREAGAQTLVTVSPVGIERILGHAGIAARRLAPPMHVGRHRLFACRIELGSSLCQPAPQAA
ncbi:acyl-homoserine-lactone synthase [Variovorax sp. RB3P1]|jgi:N-acyl-L-homoserine lactone synthetase|uniref:acyl-homoserine-lactone synthase n=1 Tax=Variovorax sp. RB3P1 TaxID=3443732 RepID=UPI003F46E181